MITQAVAKGVAILAGTGGFLACAAVVLTGRLFASPHRRKIGRHAAWRRRRRVHASSAIEREPGPSHMAEPVAGGRQRSPSTTIESQQPESSPTPRVGKPVRAKVRPVGRTLWEHRHWEPRGNVLHGFYRTPLGSFEGEIQQYRSSCPRFFISSPPPVLHGHEHWICFHETEDDRFWVHLAPKPKDPDTGIREIERFLIEALSRRSDG